VAQIVLDEQQSGLYCLGCGARYRVLHWFFDSRVRGPEPWRGLSDQRCSEGPEVAAFAARHAACPEPRRSVSEAGGIVTVDRRYRRP
jgi:hypothetical protein